MHTNQPDVALSGCPRAMEITPSVWRSPVTLVRSIGMGGKPPWHDRG